jgi:hypothetical protein
MSWTRCSATILKCPSPLTISRLLSRFRVTWQSDKQDDVTRVSTISLTGSFQLSRLQAAFNCLAYRQLSANFMVVTTILFTHTTFGPHAVWCFITIVKTFLTLILTTVYTVYLIWKKGSRRVCRSTGDAYSSMAPDPTSYIFRGPCTPILWIVFPIGLMRLNTVCYICHFMASQHPSTSTENEGLPRPLYCYNAKAHPLHVCTQSFQWVTYRASGVRISDQRVRNR